MEIKEKQVRHERRVVSHYFDDFCNSFNYVSLHVIFLISSLYFTLEFHTRPDARQDATFIICIGVVILLFSNIFTFTVS